MEENKNLQIRIQSWEHYTMVLQSYKGLRCNYGEGNINKK